MWDCAPVGSSWVWVCRWCWALAIIKETYEESFAIAYETYKQSVKKDSSIRFQDVKDYLSKKDDIQVKPKPKTYTSCVSPGVKFEFEIELK